MATPEIPEDLLIKLLGQITQDPGIPVENPTLPAWQVPAHPLAEIRSKDLPQRVDFAIIGSGITGCSVAKTLLENSASGAKTVTVFEARGLTTGATSRNGGFLMSHAPAAFSAFARAFGIDAAVKIARFCERTLETIREVAKAEGLYQECQIRDVETIVTSSDAADLAKLTETFKMYQENVPEFAGTYTPLSKEEAEKKHGLKNITGAHSHPSRVFWPYRLITNLFARLLERYPERFSIETRTPVTSIAVSASQKEHDADAAYPYILTTPRGVVRAAKVFHCTSGFTGHLLPALRGPIFPCRLHMMTADPEPEFGNRAVSWLWHQPVTCDPETRLVEQGLYWMQQNARTGELFYGGDTQRLDDYITADDSAVSRDAAENLKTLLPSRIFARGWSGAGAGADAAVVVEPKHSWCGILSMTADLLPIVGPVPSSLSGRQDPVDDVVVNGVNGDADKVSSHTATAGEWVAAGFNGYGMGQCWSSGEAIARMALGERQPDWLPDVYLSTEERLTGASMTKEAALQSFFDR